jgi:CRP-like cAMP-binding protein
MRPSPGDRPAGVTIAAGSSAGGARFVTPQPAEARRNAILNSLDPDQLGKLATNLEQVPLKLGDVLYEADGTVDVVYFPIVGVVSIVAELNDDQTVEAASVGHEGMVGLSAFLGAGAPSERALVQVAGHALRMTADTLHAATAAIDGPLHTALRRYTQAMLTQLARNAACNRVHSVRQRAARWLLMTADRMDSPSFDLTQEFLAQMLAVRRASVSDVAQSLAQEGCIAYTRGTITILNRARLQAHACDCYRVIAEATTPAARSFTTADTPSASPADPDLASASPRDADCGVRTGQHSDTR